MVDKKVLIGSTIKLTYNFYSRADNVTPADVDPPTIKVFDYNRVQIGATIILTGANEIGVGSFLYQFVVPNNPPYIDVECTADNGGYPDVSRDRIELYWSESDLNVAPVVTLTEGTNTYVTLADANAYFANRLSSETWDGTGDSDKSKALIMATKNLDRLVFKGSKINIDQPLQFPRYFKEYIEAEYLNLVIGVTMDIPPLVQDACCEEAIAILGAVSTPNTRATLQQQGVKRIKFGNAEEEYVTQSGINNTQSSQVKTILRPYLATSIPISRGRR
jgi:hypothetical protein